MSACTALAEQASAGTAAALRAVDCMANETASGAFARLFGAQGALLPVLTIALTIYVALFAFALITGRSRLGISMLTPRMVTVGVVLTFATSWIAWQQVVWNLTVAAPDEIASVILGTRGSASLLFADRVDLLLTAIGDASQAASGPGGASQAGAFSPAGAMWLGAMLLMLGTLGVLVTSRIALGVMLAVGPVFVVLALFERTRGLTAGWLRALVLCALTPLGVVLAGSLMLELAVPVVAGLASEGREIDPRSGMALFLIGAVHCALMAMMFRLAGAMVSGWRVFGLAKDPRPARDGADGRAPAPPPVAAPLMPVMPQRRVQGLVPQAAADGAAGASGADAIARRPVATAPSSAWRAESAAGLPPLARNRARGIGSRFAAPRRLPSREVMR